MVEASWSTEVMQKKRVLYFGCTSLPPVSFSLTITFEVSLLFAVLQLRNNSNIL